MFSRQTVGMPRQALIATAAFLGLWALWIYVVFPAADGTAFDRLIAFLLVSCAFGVVLGVVVGRYWAALLALTLVLLVPLPERCITTRESFDVISTGCSGLALDDDELPLAVVQGAIGAVLGVVAVRLRLR